MSKLKITFDKTVSSPLKSYYDPFESHMVITGTKNTLSALYHEYRHYIQFTTIPMWLTYFISITGGASTYYFILISTLFVIQFHYLSFISSCIVLFLNTPLFIVEMDANIFTIKRLIKKRKLKEQIIVPLISIFDYFSYLIVLPLLVCIISYIMIKDRDNLNEFFWPVFNISALLVSFTILYSIVKVTIKK